MTDESSEKMKRGHEVLAPGQNIYEQSPFSLISTALQQNHDLPLDAIRIIFTKAAQMRLIAHSEATPEQVEAWRSRLISRVEVLFAEPERKLLHVDITQIAPTVSEALDLLDRFPLWDEYIRNHTGYNLNGKPPPQSKFQEEPYKKWALDTIRRRKFLKSAGLKANDHTIQATPHGPSNAAINKANRLDRTDKHY